MSVANSLAGVISSGPVRRVVDRGFGLYATARRRTTERRALVTTQQETLRQLVHRARQTAFGRQHDFAGIRTVADYQARVPLRDYEAFWTEYWQPAFPDLRNVTWPGEIPYFALSSGTTTGTTKYIPVSREMLRSNRRAALTSLAWFREQHREVPLFTGAMFFLGGSTDLKAARGQGSGVGGQGKQCPPSCLLSPDSSSLTPDPRPLTPDSLTPLLGDLSGIAAKEVPALLRPFTFPPLDLALMTDWEAKLQRLAERSLTLPISLVAGVPSWLLVLFEKLRQLTGRERIADIWPTLRLVVHGGTKFDPYRTLFRDTIGSDDVHFLETYPASEGFVAAEDPRHGLLRLMVDHDIFFEFVPVEELTSPQPTRHTVAEIIPGVQYAVVLTTCAGLWSYVLGDTVCFESADPPLLRFTGRTRQFLSAFGEHLIGEEVERAVTLAAERTGSAVVDFHVGPVFPEQPGTAGRHRYFVEFAGAAPHGDQFAATLDAALGTLNEDYQAHRVGDLTLAPPEVRVVPRGGFAGWMRSRGQCGGQHKVPRLDNTGQLATDLGRWLAQEAPDDLPRTR